MCLMFVKCFKRMTFLDLIGQWWASGPVQPVSTLSQIHAGARKPSRLAHKTTPLFQARPSLFSFPNFPAQSKDLQHSSIMHREKKTREGGVNPIVAPCHTQITRGSMERTIDGGTVFLFLFNRQKKNKSTGELFLVVFFRASRESEQIGVETSTEREHSLLTGLRYSLANAQADRAVCHLRRRSSSSWLNTTTRAGHAGTCGHSSSVFSAMLLLSNYIYEQKTPSCCVYLT